MLFGCHVSIAGGINNAPERAADLGCEVFQIFSRSPQGGAAPQLSAEVVEKFQTGIKKYGFSQCLIHTPYFINYGSSNNRIFHGSVSIVRQELERASVLGVPFVVTHLGSYKDLGRKKGFAQLISGLEKTLAGYSGTAKLLIENSAGAGEIIGGEFEEIAAILQHKNLKKYRLGVCFDTCHAFASGYDLRSDAAVGETFKKFDKTVGLKNLMAIHANDSKIDIGGHRDRHDHIGRGKIGLAGFAAIVRHPKLQNLDMYLETEHDFVKEDLGILKKLRDG